MEIQHPSLSLTVALILLLPLLVLVRIRLAGPPKSSAAGSRRLPPGPRKLPILGNIHQLSSGGRLPHHVLRDLSTRHGRDLMLLRLGEIDHVVASSAEAAREIMRTHDLSFCSRPPLVAPTIMCYGNTDIACAPYGGYWRQMRKICTLELLSAVRVKASFPVREEEVSALVRSVSAAAGSAVNLSERLTSSADAVISRTAFGSKCNLGERFISALRKTEELASGFNLADLYPSLGFLGALTGVTSQMKKAHGDGDGILNQVMEEHRARREAAEAASAGLGAEKREEDLVDVLLSVKEKGGLEFPLTETNIKAVLLDMFSGGTSTVSGTLGWTMAELMRHPEVMKKAQSEVRRILKRRERIEEEDLRPLNYTKQVIREALRLHPPFPLIARVCNEPCTVMGYHVPAGSRALVNAWAIARDPRYWEDGEIFRPERFDGRPAADVAGGGSFDYLPFGGGRRACPGTAFGMASMEHALANLLFYFDWELPGGTKPEDLDMTESFGASARRKADLFLVAKPHDDLSLPAF